MCRRRGKQRGRSFGLKCSASQNFFVTAVVVQTSSTVEIRFRIVVACVGVCATDDDAGKEFAGPVVKRGTFVEVARVLEGASQRFQRVTKAVVVAVRFTIAAANPEGVELVAVAIASAFSNGVATTCFHCTRTATHATFVEHQTRAVVGECRRVIVAGCLVRASCCFQNVADAVVVAVFRARPAAHADGVELVAVAIAGTLRDVRASTGKNGAGAVTHPQASKSAHVPLSKLALGSKLHASGSVHPKERQLVKSQEPSFWVASLS